MMLLERIAALSLIVLKQFIKFRPVVITNFLYLRQIRIYGEASLFHLQLGDEIVWTVVDMYPEMCSDGRVGHFVFYQNTPQQKSDEYDQTSKEAAHPNVVMTNCYVENSSHTTVETVLYPIPK